MTAKEIAREIKEQAKTEEYSVYKLKSQDNRGKHDRARQAKANIRAQQGGE